MAKGNNIRASDVGVSVGDGGEIGGNGGGGRCR